MKLKKTNCTSNDINFKAAFFLKRNFVHMTECITLVFVRLHLRPVGIYHRVTKSTVSNVPSFTLTFLPKLALGFVRIDFEVICT